MDAACDRAIPPRTTAALPTSELSRLPSGPQIGGIFSDGSRAGFANLLNRLGVGFLVGKTPDAPNHVMPIVPTSVSPRVRRSTAETAFVPIPNPRTNPSASGSDHEVQVARTPRRSGCEGDVGGADGKAGSGVRKGSSAAHLEYVTEIRSIEAVPCWKSCIPNSISRASRGMGASIS